MNKLSSNSKKHLDTCTPLLQKLVQGVLNYVDVGVVTGHRSEKDQNALYVAGYSQLRYPKGKHNSFPSQAVDLVIYHHEHGYLWGNDEQVTKLAKSERTSRERIRTWIHMQYAALNAYIQLEAESLGFEVVWGGNWGRQDGYLTTTLVDLFHWEIADVRPE